MSGLQRGSTEAFDVNRRSLEDYLNGVRYPVVAKAFDYSDTVTYGSAGTYSHTWLPTTPATGYYIIGSLLLPPDGYTSDALYTMDGIGVEKDIGGAVAVSTVGIVNWRKSFSGTITCPVVVPSSPSGTWSHIIGLLKVV